MDAGGERQAGVSVAQIVETDARQLGILRKPVKGARERPRPDRNAVLTAEHEPVSSYAGPSASFSAAWALR
jgi:hypothetical protein